MDRALRDLERRFAASGSIEDEVALLAARRRVGDHRGVSVERGVLVERLLRLAVGDRAPDAAREAVATLTGRPWRLVDRRAWLMTDTAGRTGLRGPGQPGAGGTWRWHLDLVWRLLRDPAGGAQELVATLELDGTPLRAVEAQLVRDVSSARTRSEATLCWEGGVACTALLAACRGGAPITTEPAPGGGGRSTFVLHVAQVRDHEAMDRFVHDRTDVWVGVDPAARRAAVLTVHDRDSSA